MSENQKVTPKVFNCPSCGTPLEISALGVTNTIVCKSCRATLDATHSMYTVLQRSNELALKKKPVFELGSFGTLRGTKWKVIGFMVRADDQYDFEWEEYLLYNPFIGFRWLLHIDGHFSIASKLSAMPSMSYKPQSGFTLSINGLLYSGKDFAIYNKGKATVKYVLGEFYWRVKAGDKTTMNDYICAPYMISSEIMDGEMQWTLSEYLTNKEVFAAFSQNSLFEPWHSVAANQPNPYGNSKDLLKTTVMAVVLLFAVAFISSFIFKKTTVLNQWILEKSTTQVVSPSFVIPGQRGNLNFDVSADVNNQWVEGEFTLVNEDSGEDFSFSQGVEYYFGSDSDGSWTEGSRRDDKTISSVPGGRYHLEADLNGDMAWPQMSVSVRRNESMTINFVLALISLLLPWAWMSYRHRSFEIKRWQNSDYNPYPSFKVVGDDDE